jgi:hypothetical protein
MTQQHYYYATLMATAHHSTPFAFRTKRARDAWVADAPQVRAPVVAASLTPTERVTAVYLLAVARTTPTNPLAAVSTDELLAELRMRSDADVWVDMDGATRKGHQ